VYVYVRVRITDSIYLEIWLIQFVLEIWHIQFVLLINSSAVLGSVERSGPTLQNSQYFMVSLYDI